MAFSKKLKTLRKSKGLTQKALGALLNIDATQISRYENGETTPSPPTLKKLANALYIDAEVLTNGEEILDTSTLDSQLLNLFEETQNLAPENKKIVIKLIRAFINNEKMERMYTS